VSERIVEVGLITRFIGLLLDTLSWRRGRHNFKCVANLLATISYPSCHHERGEFTRS
jgi:hypothetical protein